MKTENHYQWLEANLPAFSQKLQLSYCLTLVIVADGDKCYGYREQWKKHGIPFCHGVALYLLLGVPPYSQEARQTTKGWVAPVDWVIKNYDRFKALLPPAWFAQ